MDNTFSMDDKLNQIIVNYLKGEASEEEQQKLTDWLNESSDNKLLFDGYRDIWLGTANQSREHLKFDPYKALKNVNRKIYKNKQVLKGTQFISMTPVQVWLRVAALILITVGIHSLASWLFTSKPKTEGQDAITEITAPLGSKSKVTLPDGTKIWLNAGSTIRYGSAFNTMNREIKLVGEAYFDVTKNKKMPFIVHASSTIDIRVVGTAFNLKAYPSEGLIETTLVRGSLVVEQSGGNQKTETILSPNQRATYIKNEGTIFLSDVDKQTIKKEHLQKIDQIKGNVLFANKVETDLFTSWKDNKLVFRNESFESLVIKLERWYDVKIHIEGKEIKNYHFNGVIENETINDVFNIISFTLPIKYTIHHNVVEVSKK